jgi:hypothetical protein
MIRVALAISATFAAVSVQAEGLAVHDLSTVTDKMKAALGPEFVARAAPNRVTLACLACAGAPMIDVLLGHQHDGTEQRVRSGETPITRLEELCREKDPTCRVAAIEAAPAVGWMSHYRMGGLRGSTAVILRDGDLLTIRSLAREADVASANAEKLIKVAVPAIVAGQ